MARSAKGRCRTKKGRFTKCGGKKRRKGHSKKRRKGGKRRASYRRRRHHTGRGGKCAAILRALHAAGCV